MDIYLCDLDTEYILYGFPGQKEIDKLYVHSNGTEVSTFLEIPMNLLKSSK